jgi:uncharacterized protein YkwD
MRFGRWKDGALLLIFLSLITAFGWHLQVDADSQSDEGSPTALGEPAQTTGITNTVIPAPPVQEDRPLFPADTLDDYAYLPVVSNWIFGPEAQQVVDLVNAERASAGCDPLVVSPQLVSAAQGHSEDMAVNDFFSHTSSDGRSPWDRIRETGYSFSSAAENIAAGYSSANSAVAAWMNSSGHRANILNCRLKETGIGYYYLQNDTGKVNYRTYWTQAFANPAD